MNRSDFVAVATDKATSSRAAMRDGLDAAQKEIDRLRAFAEGRTADPPSRTFAELAAAVQEHHTRAWQASAAAAGSPSGFFVKVERSVT